MIQTICEVCGKIFELEYQDEFGICNPCLDKLASGTLEPSQKIDRRSRMRQDTRQLIRPNKPLKKGGNMEFVKKVLEESGKIELEGGYKEVFEAPQGRK